MANWLRELTLLPEWQQCKENKLTTNEMARIIADRLRELGPLRVIGSVEADRKRLIQRFKRLGNQQNLQDSTFDLAMNALYDWGDTPLDSNWNGTKVCWIKTL